MARRNDHASAGRPLIVAVDDEPERVDLLERALRQRYEPDYEVLMERSPAVALDRLRAAAEGGAEVALVLADAGASAHGAFDLLAAVAEVCPDAKRAVLVAWGEAERVREQIIAAAALGRLDGYVVKPWRDADEAFHREISDLLADWDRWHRPQGEVVRIVGDAWDPYVHTLRDALQRSGVPHGFYESTSERGRQLLEGVDPGAPFPVVIVYDGHPLLRPEPADVAAALGVNVTPEQRDFDLVVVGAGPAGLAAAVYGASEGLRVLVVELEALGGQASTSSLIRNYLGFPRGLSGAELAVRAYTQAWFFGARFLFGRQAIGLRTEGTTNLVALDDGSDVRGRAVVLAPGVSYRRLGIERLEALLGRGVFYGAPVSEAPGLAGEDVAVVGGGNSSAQAALHLARFGARVTLVVRRGVLDEMSDYLVQEIGNRPTIAVRLETILVDAVGESRLRALVVRDTVRGVEETLPAAAVFILIGALPRTDWLPAQVARDERGYVLTGSEVPRGMADRREPLPFETGMPGVFAAGDVRLGSMKRVAGAVGEGSSAIRMVHEYLGSVRD